MMTDLDVMTDTVDVMGLLDRCAYDQSSSRYWFQQSQDRWIDGSERQMRRWLADEGLSPFPERGAPRSQVDEAIVKIERLHRVEWAGIVAGRRAGRARVAGGNVLVTQTVPPLAVIPPGDDAQRLILSPEDGHRAWDDLTDCKGWPTLGRYLRNLLSCDKINVEGEREAYDQRIYFFGWLQRTMRALYSYEPNRGHAVLIAGEPGCGKTLLITLLTEIMGGRSSNPLRWIEGDTSFNKDIFGAPLMVVDDEGSKTHIGDRKILAAKVKQVVAVERLRMEGKGADALMLEPMKRLIMATNLEEQNLLVFPPMDDDIRDKVMLFKAYAAPFPWPPELEEREIFTRLLREAQHFLYWLTVEFRLPVSLVSQRFGITEWHHPEILEGIDYLSPETRLLGWIERTLLRVEQFWDGQRLPLGVWMGTATDLEAALKDPETGLSFKERDKVPAANPTLGKYLTTLSTRQHLKGRICQQRLASGRTRIWRISDTKNLKSDTRSEASVTEEGLL